MIATSAPPPMSAGLRRFVYLTAAITGAAILVVEILGAKMLSPYVGSSHFVWTSQITVTLISLALGYYFGGWLVDRSPALPRLYNCITAAALYLGVTVLACERIAYAFLHFNLAVGALLSSLFLFLVPLTLLAATGPFLIRVLAQSLESVGGQVGRLSAISTLGSVGGTLLIGYALLPHLPNSTTMYATAGVLLLLVMTYYVVWARAEKTAIAATAIGAGVLFASSFLQGAFDTHTRQMTRLYLGNSNFGQLQVLQQKSGSRRFYLNDFLVQNTYDKDQKASLSLFTYMLHELAWGYSPTLTNALCIGLGVGIVPGAMAREGVQVDVVEINPAIVPVAREYFDFDDSAVNMTIADGRFVINKSRKQYDTIILDAFLGDSSPSHLMSREAFSEMARLLGESGVLVINSFGDFRPGRDFFVASLDKTLRAVFKDVRIHASGNGNVFFAASQRSLTLRPRPNRVFPSRTNIEAEFAEAMNTSTPPNPASGIILTDDFNPAEFHDSVNREQQRRTLALSVRDL